MLPLVFAFHNLELLAALCLEKLEQDFRRVVGERLQRDVLIIERLQDIVENGFCTRGGKVL